MYSVLIEEKPVCSIFRERLRYSSLTILRLYSSFTLQEHDNEMTVLEDIEIVR